MTCVGSASESLSDLIQMISYNYHCWVLVEYVPTFSPGLNFPRAHCYDTRQCTAAIAVMPLAVKLLLLGEGIVVIVSKRKRTDRDRQTDRQLLLLAPPIRLLDSLPLICFLDGTKS